MFEKIVALFRPNTSQDFVMVLEKVGGGLHKRADENRELLELLQKKSALLLEECPWVVGWLKSNDEFFDALDAIAIATTPQFTKSPGFPRVWPEQQSVSNKHLKLINEDQNSQKNVCWHMIPEDFDWGEVFAVARKEGRSFDFLEVTPEGHKVTKGSSCSGLTMARTEN